MWPASALLTGNGVAFVLRVPGTEHGDWWSMNGWWIFAGTSAIALLSKYLIKVRGRHIFNPSNFGLVLCFLLLGAERADPLALWWGPLSPALVLALVLIVVGRLPDPPAPAPRRDRGRLLARVRGGHRRARGERPHDDGGLARRPDRGRGVLVAPRLVARDPRLPLLHDHRPEDDPGRAASGRRVYAVGVGLLATLLIAPQTTEFATKVAILGALFLVCATRGAIELVGASRAHRVTARLAAPRRIAVASVAVAGALAYAGLVVAAGIPARPGARRGSDRRRRASRRSPSSTRQGSQIDASASADDRPRRARRPPRRGGGAAPAATSIGRRPRRAAPGSPALWRADPRRFGQALVVPTYDVETMQLSLHRGAYQGPPTVVARLEGSFVASAQGPGRATVAGRGPEAFLRTVRLALERGRYRIVQLARAACPTRRLRRRAAPGGRSRGATLEDVATTVGLDFRQGAFRFGMSFDPTAMMGGGVCWLDYDRDGWLDLFVVNSYAQADASAWESEGRPAAQRALPERAGKVPGRERCLGRRPASPWQRLRGGRPRPRRAYRPLRHDGRVQRRDRRLRRASLERGRRLLHRGRSGGRDQRARLARRRRGRRRERRRAPGSVRRGLHRPQLADPRLVLPASRRTITQSATSSTSTRVGARTTARRSGRSARPPASRPSGSATGSGRSSPTSTMTVGSTCTWPTTPTRISCTRTWRVQGISASASRRWREERASTTRMPEWGSRPRTSAWTAVPDLLVTNSREQLHAAYRSRASANGRAFTDARPEISAAFGTKLDRLGRVVGGPEPRRRSRSRRRQRRDPGAGPREERAAGSGAREPSRARAVSHGSRRRSLTSSARRGSTAGDSLRPTTTTTATSTSRSTPSADGSSSSRTAVHAGTGSRSSSPASRREPSSRLTPEWAQARPRGARGQQLPVLGGSPRALRSRRRDDA